MHPFTLMESLKAFGALKPATDAAGRTGRYFNVAFGHKIYFVFVVDQGNAAQITCDVVQATNAAGAGVKVLGGLRRIWTNLDAATNDAIVRQADALSFQTDVGVKEKLVVIEVNPADMDLANGFTYLAPRTSASNVANLTSASAIIVPQYPGAAQPSYTA